MININKRGQTHIEAILATVIFIGFIFVLLYIIKPFETQGSSSANAETLIITVPNYLRGNISEFGINISDQTISNCFFVTMGTGRVKTYKITSNSETLVDSKGTSSNLFIKGTAGFYNVYQSEEFDDSVMSTSCSGTSEYQIASSRKINALSYNKIIKLNKTYDEDYQKTKEDSGVLDSSDWGLIIIDDSGREIIRSLNTPKSQININVKETSKLMFYPNGTIQNVRLRVYSY